MLSYIIWVVYKLITPLNSTATMFCIAIKCDFEAWLLWFVIVRFYRCGFQTNISLDLLSLNVIVL